ncbi:MAG: D-glycero-beta-D-manno-heptose 1-phosphate adenylyltransferase [Deltaproteobacteria bacterium]|nr:D-glycero-beta-D-manno-heptose 1-phosphate adenylyltransferase [Deltaproteobacteria bacterium]
MKSTQIVPAALLAEHLASLRREGKRIVFTNGCFDLLHPGHLYTLAQAKALGEVLVVAINSDASVKRLKGERRPILNQEERAVMLSALAVVDYVTIFAEDTPLEVIRLLLPDVLVKGGDWGADAVVGRDVVEAYGGQVVLIPYQSGFSTTDIIERIVTIYTKH